MLKMISMFYKMTFSYFIAITANAAFTQPILLYKDAPNLLQEKSFGFISEDLKHDTAFICI